MQAWLALAGGSVAVAAFVLGRLDANRAQASAVYAMVISFRYGAPERDESPNHTTVKIHNDSGLPVIDVGLSAWEWGARPAHLAPSATDAVDDG